MNIQAIGVCRYSLLVEGGFKAGPRDLRERAAILYDERRMAERLAWFTHVTLPSLLGQTDRRFRFAVLVSDAMPDRWLERLTEVVPEGGPVELQLCPVGKHHQIANAALRDRLDPDAEVVAQFRVDDDDAVALDYVAQVRSDFESFLAGLLQRWGRVSADYTGGVVVQADGRAAPVLRQIHEVTWNCGQTLYTRPKEAGTLFRYGHHRMHVHMPTVTFPDRVMFVRGRHGSNDSAFRIPTADASDARPDLLRRRFGIDLDQLQQALAAIGPA